MSYPTNPSNMRSTIPNVNAYILFSVTNTYTKSPYNAYWLSLSFVKIYYSMTIFIFGKRENSCLHNGQRLGDHY